MALGRDEGKVWELLTASISYKGTGQENFDNQTLIARRAGERMDWTKKFEGANELEEGGNGKAVPCPTGVNLIEHQHGWKNSPGGGRMSYHRVHTSSAFMRFVKRNAQLEMPRGEGGPYTHCYLGNERDCPEKGPEKGGAGEARGAGQSGKSNQRALHNPRTRRRTCAIGKSRTGLKSLF